MCTLWRDRCSRHQWLHSHKTSRVYVRYSRTQSIQADVRSAVPRTTPATRNLISIGRADEASRRWDKNGCVLPKNMIVRTPVQASLYERRFRRPALPHSLCSQKVGQEWLCATHLRLCVHTMLSYCCPTPEAASPSSYIYTRRGRPTFSNSRHLSHPGFGGTKTRART
jgi:hypothetical protein